MTSRGRRVLQLASARWIGEKVIPMGGVARDRRLLRQALGARRLGRVLVIGPSIAARQVLRGQQVDVTGTNPYADYVTVCSTVRASGSLPPRRWDTVVVTDPGDDLTGRLKIVQTACRPAATLLVVDRGERAVKGGQVSAIRTVASLEAALSSGTHRLWIARMLS